MNPFDEYRKIYIAACFIIATIYAFTLGGIFSISLERNLPITLCIADGLIYGGVLYLTGIVFWNIFRFTIPAYHSHKYKHILILALAILFCLLVIVLEMVAIYLCFPSFFDFFVCSIPVRLFITFLIFVIIRLFYVIYNEIHGKTEESLPAETSLEDASSPDATTANYAITPKTEKSSVDRITVRSGQKIIIIPVDEIIYIKADGDYISINTAKGNWLKEQTMKYTEDVLPIDYFVRIHRSYIININYISRIERYGEKQQVILHNNEKIKVSAARYQVLKQVLNL